MSPGYVLAAANHLGGLNSPLILTVERQGELQGLAVLESISGSRRMPLKHLRSWQTPHTYFDAPLLRTGMAERSMEEIWKYHLRGSHDWHAIEFPRFPNSEAVTKVFDGSSQAFGVQCLKGTCWERACLIPRECSHADVIDGISLKRSKSLRRGWRELEKVGPVRFEFQQEPEEIFTCAEEMLHLESLGWKAEAGTALASQLSHLRFFREMIAGMGTKRNVFFSRILVGDQAVVSVANLVAGNTAYAFKLGWNPEFERGCPGYQLKLQTALRAAGELPGIQMIDSCSQPGSFIEHVWSQRRSFCSRMYLTSPVSHLAASMVNGLRWVKNNAVAVSRHLFHPENDLGAE